MLIERPTRAARSAWEQQHGWAEGHLDRALAEAIGPGWEGGRSEAEIEARLCAACGLEASGLADLQAVLAADERVCPAWAQALDGLAGRTDLAIITNSGPTTRATLIARHRLERWFPVIVISAEEGLSKPDPRIYLSASELLGRAPTECLFVDDRAANVEGAQAVGMGGVVFTSSAQTIPMVLERLGV
ncbi:MAG TPA: HAD-IA family hydrolase [Phenylobacterium sp.]|nr:HAD-IA family hydrolase [Phenylobacterium sp.]